MRAAEVDPARTKRLLSLFKLYFENPAEMRHDVAGKAVYLGMMMNGDQGLRVKPQNLLLNLPLGHGDLSLAPQHVASM